MDTYPLHMDIKPEVKGFFDAATNTISYVVKDPSSPACAVIDSVMDFDFSAGRITYGHADELIAYIQAEKLKLEWIIETHVHADHLSAAPYIQEKLGGKIGVGEKIMVIQDTFGKAYKKGVKIGYIILNLPAIIFVSMILDSVKSFAFLSARVFSRKAINK